jgi:opacity protein-like surface antigen
MKKIFLITVCCAILFAMSPVAYSLDGVYVGGNIGVGISTDTNFTDRLLFAIQHKDLEPDAGVALSVVAGYRPFDMLRVEGEMSYQTNDIDQGGLFTANGDISSFNLMINGYFEPAAGDGKPFQPYITFGIGWANVETDLHLVLEERYNNAGLWAAEVTYNGKSEGTFAYQVGAGVGYTLNDKITLDFKYRFQWTDDFAYNSTKVEYNSHNIYVGMRYAF